MICSRNYFLKPSPCCQTSKTKFIESPTIKANPVPRTKPVDDFQACNFPPHYRLFYSCTDRLASVQDHGAGLLSSNPVLKFYRSTSKYIFFVCWRDVLRVLRHEVLRKFCRFQNRPFDHYGRVVWPMAMVGSQTGTFFYYVRSCKRLKTRPAYPTHYHHHTSALIMARR